MLHPFNKQTVQSAGYRTYGGLRHLSPAEVWADLRNGHGVVAAREDWDHFVRSFPEPGEPIDDGGPAFPKPDCAELGAQPGMSLRDWFAGQALAGMMASDECASDSFEDTAPSAYRLADAMLAARKQEADQ
jgi:hypothetical protein